MPPTAPSLQFLMTIAVEVLEPVSCGPTPSGEPRVVPFTRGHFEGPDLRGVLLPGGTDWQVVRPDGVLEISAHYLLETEQGERLEVLSEGLRHAAPGVLERIAAGEPVAPGEYYFRTAVRFRTGAERLVHLNRTVGVAVGRRAKLGAELDYFAVT